MNLRQQLRVVPSVTQKVVAPREIAVRFTSASGLIATVRKPLNSFRWVGPGTLQFGELGVLVTARRSTLLGPRQIRRFIPSAEINDVYREANAVQVHLRGARNPYFRLWTEDAATAAQVVALLPTHHTIEFESAVSAPQIETVAWKPVVWLTALLVAAAVGVWVWLPGNLPTRVPPERPQPVPSTASATRADVLLAEQDLIVTLPAIERLKTEFGTELDALMSGAVSQEQFAEDLQHWLLPQWNVLEADVRRSNATPGSLQERADDDLMGVISNWQLGLRAYAEDLHNQRQVVRTFDYLQRAQGLQWRAETMQRDLERRPE